jgi:O-antigen ligase
MTYAILQSGARTFLVTYVLIIFMFITLNYKLSVKQVIITAAAGLVGYLLLMNSPMLGKILSRNSGSSSDYFSRFTSGRTVFWVEKLEAFLTFPIKNKIVGGGFGSVNTIRLSYTSASIDAHNDIINIIIDEGLIGLGLYIFILFYYFKNKMMNFPILSKISFIMLYLFTAFFTRYLPYVSLLLTWFVIVFMDLYKRNIKNEDNNKENNVFSV